MTSAFLLKWLLDYYASQKDYLFWFGTCTSHKVQQILLQDLQKLQCNQFLASLQILPLIEQKNRYFYEAGNAGSACYGNTHFYINQIINQSSNSRTFHPPLKIVKTTSSLEKTESIFTLFYIITIPLK